MFGLIVGLKVYPNYWFSIFL